MPEHIRKPLTGAQAALIAKYQKTIAETEAALSAARSELRGVYQLCVLEMEIPDGTTMRLSEDGKELIEVPQEQSL